MLGNVTVAGTSECWFLYNYEDCLAKMKTMKIRYLILSVIVLTCSVLAQKGEVEARKTLNDAGSESPVILTQCRADLASWLNQDKQSTKVSKGPFWFDRLSTEELKRRSTEAEQCGLNTKDPELAHQLLLFCSAFKHALLERAEYVIKEHALTEEYLLE